MAESNIARFRQQQALQEQSAQQALYGLAAIANHASINARMQRGADYLLTLLHEGKYEQVVHLMETPTWGLEEGNESCRGQGHQVKEPTCRGIPQGDPCGRPYNERERPVRPL